MRAMFLVSALVAALLMGSGTAQAFELEATLDAYYWSYAEEIPGNNDFVDEYSNPVFISLGLRRWDTNPDSFNLLFTSELGGGPSKYAGSGKLDGYYYYKFRGEIYGAYRFRQFAPFIGLGYRWLYDDSGGKTTSTGFSSYDRQSQYFYLPIGSIVELSDTVRFKAQFNYLMYGKQTSYLSDIQGFSDVDNDQNAGWGVDATLHYRISGRWGVQTFFRYWQIDDSEIAVGYINGSTAFTAQEPRNQSVEAGIGVSYRF